MKMDEFFSKVDQYRLGDLTTEMPHPHTQNLSRIAQEDLEQAVTCLKEVDLMALNKMLGSVSKIEDMRIAIGETLTAGGRIFLCGCGATGRLSLLLEFLWREKNPGDDSVVAFMAGGDIALVHSLEGFEDYPEYGKRHLKQLGFSDNDLLISCTEGGETPYVIGATEAACEISKRDPYFLYCNPDSILCEKIERSKRVIENPNIQKIELFVGPMALSGSTRMQASTVLQLAVGMALLDEGRSAEEALKQFIKVVEELDFLALVPFIKEESAIYKAGEYLMYTPLDFGITVFTDTTERSPTFSLPSFESPNAQVKNPSLCYIMLPKAESKEEAWHALLNRDPRNLNWVDVDKQTMDEYAGGFDFSKKAIEYREQNIGAKTHHFFEIKAVEKAISFKLNDCVHQFICEEEGSLYQHTLLKLLLNIHSTLIMGRLNRYQSNVMTWVKPNNGKLVDRAARYVELLLQERGQSMAYETIVRKIFELRRDLKDNEAIVLKTLDTFIESGKESHQELKL
ncbi:MAG: hypothetical protein KDD33_02495 [Bdellovibrionales bacterium]|nr:hypothetical protein [Bdellovibrionales bacterium]